MQTTGVPAKRPKHRFPACPATAGAVMCGRSPYGIFTRPSRVSAKSPRPLPRTTPTLGWIGTRFLTAKTQSSRRAAIDEGGDCDIEVMGDHGRANFLKSASQTMFAP